MGIRLPRRKPAQEPAEPAVGTTNGQTSESAETKRSRKHVPGFQLDCGTGLDVPHVGIVFVHGIGSQEPGETLLDWGSKIIGLLLDTRVAQKAAGDPVIASELDPGPSGSRYIELQLPKAVAEDDTPIPEQHWVMTEAWWAQRVHPPAFGEMAEWLGPRGAIKRILLAMLPRDRGEHDARLRPELKVVPLTREGDRVKEAAEPGGVYKRLQLGPRFEGALDAVERIAAPVSNVAELLAKVGAGLYLQAISALILVIYGGLRSIEKILPIGPLRNGTLTRPIDEFMLDWFGDVYVLLRDPAQAASVRGRLIDALQDLHENQCQSVVVVAHSGGAIVSYMTLADEAKKHIKVDRLITLGEGLNLAWRLTTGDDEKIGEDTRQRYQRLYSNMFDGRGDLEWHDFWASQDPAPVGVLAPDEKTLDTASLGKIRSHAVWNRLAFGQDHGTYWDNDEEFLMPMVRLLAETRGGTPLFGTDDDGDKRSNRRRRRLSVLSLWRQLSLVAPTAAIMIAFALGSEFVHRASDAMSYVWSKIPGADIINGPLNTVRDLGIATSSPGFELAETGVWVIAALVGLVTLFALVAAPERPVPWSTGRYQFVAFLLRLAPWAVAVPVVTAVALGALRFFREASEEGMVIGTNLVTVIVPLLGLAALLYMLFGSPSAPDPKRRFALGKDALEMVATIAIMIIVAFLALSPFVATIAYPEVGSTVLGVLTVLAAFQIIGRIGTWRWSIWDGRERVAARTGKDYPPIHRILFQMLVLFLTVSLAFAAVVADNGVLATAAVVCAAFAVLVGIAVDVFDAARQQRTVVGDAMMGPHTRAG